MPLLTQGFQCIGGTPPPNISQNTPPASQKKDKLQACNRRCVFQATALAMTSLAKNWSEICISDKTNFGRAYKVGGGEWAPPPIRSFLNFSKMNYFLDLPLSVGVHISLRHIWTQVWWESVTMVTRYDVISSRWSSHFWRKMCVFYPFFGENAKNTNQK